MFWGKGHKNESNIHRKMRTEKEQQQTTTEKAQEQIDRKTKEKTGKGNEMVALR